MVSLVTWPEHMRSVTDHRPPAVVNKYLLSSEKRRPIVRRRHPAVLIPPIARALGGLLVALAMSATILHNNKLLLTIVWALVGFLFLRLFSNAADWSVDYFVATPERLLLISGASTRKVKSLQLTKVTDISYEHSGKVLGYGKFIVESADQRQELRSIDYLPRPEQLYLEICGLIYSATANEHRSSGSNGDD